MQEEQNIELAKKAIEESFKTAKEFIGKLVNPGLEEGGGIIQDTIKFWRFKNQINIIIKAKKFLEDLGLEPKKVLPKTLVPLLEAGSLEEDESMQEKWSALLANAAHPNSKEIIRPSFVEILKELSPEEAMIMEKIFEMIEGIPVPRADWYYSGADGKSIKEKFSLSDLEFEIAIDNLYRLQLCQPPSNSMTGYDRFQTQTKDIICITELGYAFVKACKFQY